MSSRRIPLAVAAALLAVLGLTAGLASAAAPVVDVVHHTVSIRGTDQADTIVLRADRGELAIDLDGDGTPDESVRHRRIRAVVVQAGDGDDSVRIERLRRIPATIDGGAGADTLLGARGPERFLAGDGDDIVDGDGGDDAVLLGAGNDRFAWHPGDGSDRIDAQDGHDELTFAGSTAAERFGLAASGARVRLTRDVDGVRMDLDGLERIAASAGPGADSFTAGDLSTTPVNDLDLDLGADGEPDRVVSRGSDGSEFADVFGGQAGVFVLGMPTFLRIGGADAEDALIVEALGGSDRVTTSGVPVQLTIDGGAGDDDLAGGTGGELLLGRAGDDFADPNGGADTAVLGTGDDILRWDPGDGSDVVEGQSGHDVMLFLGSAASETFAASANGRRVRFLRDVGSIAMDLDGIEKTDTLAQGGADTVTVGDLSGTALELVETNLSGLPGVPASDGAADRVILDGSDGDDAVTVAGAAGTVDVTGLPATIRATRAEGALDQLVVNGRGGDDTLDRSGLAPGTIRLAFSD